MNVTFSGWFGFWIFLAVFVVCEAVMYLKGHETAIWKHKTAAEFELQRAQVQAAAKRPEED